jgi:hypothetical protein
MLITHLLLVQRLRVELYLHSPYGGPPGPVTGFPLPLFINTDSLRAGRSGVRKPVGGEILHARTDRPPRPTQPPVRWVPGLCRKLKRPRRGVNHPPLLGPRLKNG